MKKILLLHLLILSVCVSSFGQLVIGAAGNCVVDGDPNAVASLETQDVRYECLRVYSDGTKSWYKYVDSLALGSRWVVDVGAEVDSSTYVTISALLDTLQVFRDTLTVLGGSSITILPDSILLDSASIQNYLTAQSIDVREGDLIEQKGEIYPIRSRVIVDGGHVHDRYAAFPAIWNTGKALYVRYREGAGHIFDGNVVFAKSYDQGQTWKHTTVATNPDLETDYGLSSAGIYVNSTGRIYLTYRNGLNYNASNNPPFTSTLNYYVYSDDEGETWSTPVAITVPDNNSILGETKILYSEGRLLHPYYNLVTEKAGVAYSDDEDFSTWTFIPFPGSLVTNEVGLVKSGSQLIAFIRTSGVTSTVITRSVSNDNGLSWSAPANVTFPAGYDPVNGAYPNSILLPSATLITHARHTASQYLTLLISYDKGLTYSEYLVIEPNVLSMYADFCILSENKIGVVYGLDYSGSGAGVFYSTIDIDNSTYIQKTNSGFEVISLASKGGGLDVIENYIGKPNSQRYDYGYGFEEDRLIDLGDNQSLLIGSKNSGDLLIVNSNPTTKKVAIGATLAQAQSNTKHMLDVYGHVGAGDATNNNLFFGFSAGSLYTTGIRSFVSGYNAAALSTTIDFSSIKGSYAARAATSISNSVLDGYAAGESSSSISNSVLIGKQNTQGVTGAVTNVISIGYDNLRTGGTSASNKIIIGSNTARYHTGTNCILLGDGLITGSGHADNSINNALIIGMNSNRLIQGDFTAKTLKLDAELTMPLYSTQVYTGTPSGLWPAWELGTGRVIQRTTVELLSDLGISSSPFTKSGNYIYPTTLTDSIGVNTSTPDADFHLDGDFKIEHSGGNATIFHNDSLALFGEDGTPLQIQDSGGLTYAQFDPFNGDFSSYINRIHNGSTWKNALRKTAANSSLQLGSTTAGDWSAIYLTHKIGIENNDPQEQLSINDNTSGAVYAHFTNTTTGTSTNDGAKIGLSASEVLTINQIENAPIDIGTNNTIQVTIEADGDVIIYNDIIVDNSNNVRIVTGSGSPESAVTAGIGSTYHRTDGGAGTSFYVKESGTGNTGWIAK